MNIHSKEPSNLKQECIPVGTAHFSCHMGGGGIGSVQRGVCLRGCLPRGVSAQQVSVWGGVFDLGCLPRGLSV